jgi:hypothetical protein
MHMIETVIPLVAISSPEKGESAGIEGALITASLTAGGFLIKSIIGAWKRSRAEERATLAEIQRFAALLKSSEVLFKVQIQQARDLLSELREKNAKIDEDAGYESNFTKLYEQFTPEERTAHSMIRSITDALAKVNAQMGEWLEKDTQFKTAAVDSTDRDLLAEMLYQLEVHLHMWHAKYARWIPDNPAHAIVFLADEQNHGVGFPMGLDPVINKTVEELKTRYKNPRSTRWWNYFTGRSKPASS